MRLGLIARRWSVARRRVQPGFSLPMTLRQYADYLLTETNVALAIRSGAAECEIRAWLHGSLEPVFGGSAHDVLFPGYIACMRV